MERLIASLEQLERLRFPADLSFDRTGQALAATISPASHAANQSYQSRIWRFQLDGTAEPLTDGPGADALPRYSPADDRLAFVSDRTMAGRMSPFLLEAGRIRPIGAIAGSVEDLRWTADGASLIPLAADRGLDAAATSGATRLAWGEDEDPAIDRPGLARRRLFKIALADGATTEIGPADLTVWSFDLLGSERAIAIASADPSERGWHHAALARLDFAGRSAEIIYRPAWQLQGPTVDPSGSRVAFLEGWSSDRGLVAGEIRILDLASGRIETLAADKLSNVSWIQWRDKGSLWFAGWSRLGSVFGLVHLDGRIERIEHEDAIIGTTSFLAQISPRPDRTGFAAVRETVGSPPEIVVRQADDKTWRPISALNGDIGQDLAAAYPEIRVVSWSSADGLQLEGLVLLPRERAAGPLPMIVDIHGGPSWAARHAFNPGFALPYAAAGYAVFLPNYRGNVGWGQDFGRLNIGDPGGAEFEDILTGVDHCIAQGFARPDRLGVTGASYGGYLTAWAVATTRRFQAAVMVSGIANHWSCHYSCNHDFSEFIVGGPMTEERFRRIAIERSPMMRLDKPGTPTLIIHGREDRCTPLGQAQEFYAGLVERGVAAELVVYTREGHGLREQAHQRDFWRRAVAWFDRYLRQE